MHRTARELPPFLRGSFFQLSPLRRFSILCAAALCPVVMSGCNLFMIAAYLIGGPPSVEPDFETATRTSLTDEDVTVAVACYVPIDLRADIGNETLDREVARLVTQKLTLNKIKVREPNAVLQWMARNPDWEEPGEIAEAMQVTHVIYIDISRFSLWEENSATLLRGRADAIVTVHAVEEEGTEAVEIYGKEVAVQYPLAVPRDSSAQNPGRFRQEFMLHLSDKIGWLFYPHYNGDDMSSAT
ncbi:hypothetical protein [Alienimonas californiensis]|uniref:Uncharacterized protein n=1 Tax=Alienimonas californiensis TaxID=2527989 RepID=A0A517P8Y4_9PLAN|nr:hypothetical protein [Alienimonas californiensis]QDT15836.1 hypothetical protein CA12_19310 [Alienimonas californiensis]